MAISKARARLKERREYGARIRHFRLHANLTLADMSRKTGIRIMALSLVERGKRSVRLDEFPRIIKALGVPAKKILDA